MKNLMNDPCQAPGQTGDLAPKLLGWAAQPSNFGDAKPLEGAEDEEQEEEEEEEERPIVGSRGGGPSS